MRLTRGGLTVSGATLIPRSEPATRMLYERRVNPRMREKMNGTVDWQENKFRCSWKVPFIEGNFVKTAYDSVAFLGFLGSAFVSKVSAWSDRGALNDDIPIFSADDSPLKWLVSNRQSRSSGSGPLPPARRRVGHWVGGWWQHLHSRRLDTQPRRRQPLRYDKFRKKVQ